MNWTRVWRMGLTLSALLPLNVANAQTGVQLLPSTNRGNSFAYGNMTTSTVAVTGQAFTSAVHVQQLTANQLPYASGIGWLSTASAKKGDLIVANMWIRNANPNPATQILHVSSMFMLNGTPYTQEFSANAPLDDAKWHRYGIPFVAGQDLPSGQWDLQFQFGSLPQTFELGKLTVTDYGPLVKPYPLSITSQFAFYYPGRNTPSAPWRVQALANIETYRKAPLAVKVLDSLGHAVSNATVSVNEVRPNFLWGTVVAHDALLGTWLSASDKAKYQNAALHDFNEVSLENDLKWPPYEADPTKALTTLAFLSANGLPSRGHNLIWPSLTQPYYMPTDCKILTATQLNTRIDNHFKSVLSGTSGKLYEWDVLNEPYANSDVQGLIGGVPLVTATTGKLGNLAMPHWFSEARTLAPGVGLFLNDYQVFENLDPTHEVYDLALLKYIRAHGASVDGFGFQGHFGWTGPDFNDMAKTLKDFDPLISRYGVTEFDFQTIDDSMQADLMSDFMTFIFGQPKFTEFQMWGFWDGQHWLNSAPLFNLNWTLKPSGTVWMTLTKSTWQTHVSGATGLTGAYAVRAFKGQYQIKVTSGAKSKVVTTTVTGPTSVTIAL